MQFQIVATLFLFSFLYEPLVKFLNLNFHGDFFFMQYLLKTGLSIFKGFSMSKLNFSYSLETEFLGISRVYILVIKVFPQWDFFFLCDPYSPHKYILICCENVFYKLLVLFHFFFYIYFSSHSSPYLSIKSRFDCTTCK